MFIKKYRNLSIGHKVAITSGVISFSIVNLAAVIFIFLQKSTLEKNIEMQIQEKITIGQSSLSEPVWSFNQVGTAQIAMSLFDDQRPLVTKVKVIDNDDIILFENANDSHSDTDKYKESSIYFEKQIIGKLVIYYNSDFIVKTEASKMILISCIFSFLGLLASSLIYFLIQQKVIRPLKIMVQKLSMVHHGQYDTISIQNLESEFLILAKAYNKAMQTISIKDKMLLSKNESLEDLVKIRTEELEQNRAKALNSAKLAALGEMSANIAHEINNPLAVVLALQDFLKTLIPSETKNYEKIMDKLSKIGEMSQRISKIINGLRLFARDGQQDPMEISSVQNIVDDSLMICQSRFRNKGVIIKKIVPEKTVFIKARSVQISQVIINLLNNSFDAVENHPDPWITIHVSTHEDMVKISVSDCGLGIPPEIEKKMLQPFFTTKELGKGTGLGLSISHGIVMEHNGRFYLDKSSPNTQFTVEFKVESESEVLTA